MRFLLQVLVIICAALPAFALSIEEALFLALQNDDSSKQQMYILESQKYLERSALAAFMPMASINYSYAENKLFYKNNIAKLNDATKKNSTLAFQVGWNVFNGFSDFNTYKLGSNAYTMQYYTYTGSKQDVILNTKTAFISYLKARNQVEVALSTLDLLESQKKIAEISYGVGQLSKADVLKVDVQLASTQLNLLNAEISLKIALQQLEKSIGRSIKEGEEILEVSVENDYSIPSINILYDLLENRSELKYAKVSYESAKIDKLRSAGSFLPSVDLVYSYGWNGTNMSPFNSPDMINPQTDYKNAQSIGVNVKWILFKGGYDAHTYLSKSKLTNAANHALSNIRKTLRLQLSSAYENYFSAIKRKTVAEVGVSQAQENYRVTKSQYDNSEATTTDLLNANVALQDALNSLASANYDIIISVAQIERSVEQNFLNLDVYDE